MLRPYSCQLLVGARHLEDKLSVIAKNSSPNASPVQLSVVIKEINDKITLLENTSIGHNRQFLNYCFLW
ncbi:hypothetical protein BMF77_02265 [Dolichospermum sp. UHCC 0315A]|uniref:hypothetical protein n=1 Tax=Dolichospermum sp. UHCC 0315A TaxID=1914871 RepID=UPI0012519175|nr:hypothetical protein [Dolichospermum sp. UHCC 0315A]QEI41672.1 hypothetical protein BMF77_02265 [Dolichospermum sp. UHCC 0315A]